MRRVLLIGKDARTDCTAETLVRSNALLYIMSDFDNPGLKAKATEFLRAKTDDVRAVVDFAKRVKPDLAVIGPEEPLEQGVVDELKKLGIACVGPTRKLAQVETSKSFTRRLLSTHDIGGNVEYRVFSSTEGLADYLRELRQFVVKPDGLTGGKGVKVFGEHLSSVSEAVAYADSVIRTSRGRPVVIEEKLEGEEFSLQSFCDGTTVVHTIPVQDHKRALEGDLGPNTGGMGSYSCADHSLPFLANDALAQAQRINEKVAAALGQTLKEPYQGILYGGFMATADGVRILEFNARLGDPETMNILPLLKGDNFLDVCWGIASGTLKRKDVAFEAKATVCKYVVPRGYPEPEPSARTEPVSAGGFEATDHCRMYYAAVNEKAGHIFLTGSRAIAFVGIADSVVEAGEIAERAISKVAGPIQHRKDIGTAMLIERRVRHMDSLRASFRAYG